MSTSEDSQLQPLALANVRNNDPLTRKRPTYHLPPPHPHQLAYLQYRLHGRTQEQAASLVRRNARGARKWEISSWWQPAVDEALARLVAAKPQAFLALHDKALAGLSQQIDEGNTTAMVYVLDQFYGRPVARVESKTQTETKLTLEMVMLQLSDRLKGPDTSGQERS